MNDSIFKAILVLGGFYFFSMAFVDVFVLKPVKATLERRQMPEQAANALGWLVLLGGPATLAVAIAYKILQWVWFVGVGILFLVMGRKSNLPVAHVVERDDK
jgi:hypothetical protein